MLVVALVGIALLGIMAAAAATLAQQGNEQARQESELKALLAFTQNLETVLSTNNACVGIPGVIDGLKFNNGAGFAGNQFNFALASQPSGQPASLGTQLPVGSGRFVAAAGAAYAPSNILIDQLFIRNAAQIPASTTFNADLVLQARVNNRGFAPREVGKVTFTLDGGNNLVSCAFVQSAVAACEAMNCKFNSAAPKQKCVCGFPQMSCQTSPGQPQRYISGINQTTSPPTPICSDFKIDCSDPAMGGKGPGYFLSGFDQNGDPMCQPVEGGVATPTPAPTAAPTPPPTPTPTPPPACASDGDVVHAQYGACAGGPPFGGPPKSDFYSYCCSGNVVKTCDAMSDLLYTCAPPAMATPTPVPTPPPISCGGFTTGNPCAQPNGWIGGAPSGINYCYCGSLYPNGSSPPPGKSAAWQPYCSGGIVSIQAVALPGLCP